eukprot:scaffold3236_cov66-Cylindrotheca_fusiformis.AAC.19
MSSSASSVVLKTVIFLGSARNKPAFWGGDARLGDRVVNWVQNVLATRTNTKLGGAEQNLSVSHNVTIVDPLEVFHKDSGALAGISSGEMNTPTFFMEPEDLPPRTKEMIKTIENADCYLIVSPEYNHTVPPALSSVMGHFAASLYKCKPSGIITYSPGPFGGMRGAMSIIVMCQILGCLPVSKTVGIPTVEDLLELDGTPKNETSLLLTEQMPEMLNQVEWMAMAMKNQRDLAGPF